MYISLKDMYMWKIFLFPRSTPSHFLRQPPAFLAKNTVDKDIAAKKESMVKLPVEQPYKTALSSHPHKHMNNINNALVVG